MFGYRQIGRLDQALLTCAAEDPDGTVWVGCSGARPGFETLDLARWSGTYAPALFSLADETFTPHADFDDSDRWVYGLLADSEGTWACGGILTQGPALWRIESGVVTQEIAVGATTWGDMVSELAWVGDDLYALGDGNSIWRRNEASLERIGLAQYDPEVALAGMGGRAYWLTEDGLTAWLQGIDLSGAGDSAALILRNAHCAWQDRLWSIQSDQVGLSYVDDEVGTRVAPIGSNAQQALAWFDGANWRDAVSWYVDEEGIYSRLAAFGGRLWLFGELWDADAGALAEQPIVARFDGHELKTRIPWAYWIDRITTTRRRAIFVGDDEWYGQVRYGAGSFIPRGPSLVIAADIDLRVEAVRQEFGDGSGESPIVASVSQAFGDGSGESPIVTDIWQEFGDEADGPNVGEGETILWVTDDETEICMAIQITSDETADVDAQLRALVRCDQESVAVDEWSSYQEVAVGPKVTLDEPGYEVRVGVIRPAAVSELTGVRIQLLRE